MNKKNKDHMQTFILYIEGYYIEMNYQKSFSVGGEIYAVVSFKKQVKNVSFFGNIGKDIDGEQLTQELENLGIDTSNIS
ncbi:carbohydrate kinase family protein [Francisella tularensis]|uniref:hypothetical protein n=1 Tax=Francisella tularensis TaxID=263 RepID=UPI00174B534F|nr:hypothetical protein [Francisella tularensis]MBD5784282.1 hypothetical protein [Francisella tularensis subsp. holarctica]